MGLHRLLQGIMNVSDETPPKDINLEDGNWNICQNTGKLATFHTAYS
jgi:hypothetical protein